MQHHLSTPLGREMDSSLTGTFQISLTRAVVPYLDDVSRALPGGRITDIGLGVVVDGSDPARADVVDLGSAELRTADLTGPLVVMGWLYPSGLRTLQRVLEDTPPEDMERGRAYTFSMGLRVLERAGFSPLTRPSFLRVGFRDLCQDVDLHEGTAIRLLLPSSGVARIHLDYDATTLVVRPGRGGRNPELESALRDAFPGRELLRGALRDGTGTPAYHLPLPAPRTIEETRALLRKVRRGVVHLLARFETERYRAVRELLGTFGERDSLAAIRENADLPRLERVGAPVSGGTITGGGIH